LSIIHRYIPVLTEFTLECLTEFQFIYSSNKINVHCAANKMHASADICIRIQQILTPQNPEPISGGKCPSSHSLVLGTPDATFLSTVHSKNDY